MIFLPGLCTPAPQLVFLVSKDQQDSSAWPWGLSLPQHCGSRGFPACCHQQHSAAQLLLGGVRSPGASRLAHKHWCSFWTPAAEAGFCFMLMTMETVSWHSSDLFGWKTPLQIPTPDRFTDWHAGGSANNKTWSCFIYNQNYCLITVIIFRPLWTLKGKGFNIIYILILTKCIAKCPFSCKTKVSQQACIACSHILQCTTMLAALAWTGRRRCG